MMAKFHDTIENITKALVKTEKYSLEQDVGMPSPFQIIQLQLLITGVQQHGQSSYNPVQLKLYTDSNIAKIVKEHIKKEK